jgi:tetratricopeptide (TPR) repeat protein
MAPGQFRADFDVAALARSLAHQWFPLKISVADPAADAWLVDGLAVFASLLYAEDNLPPAAAQEQIDKALVKALSAENELGIREAGRLDRQTADYRALVEYKGAYVFRMLQWLVGEEKFSQILTRYVERFQNTPASTETFIRLASDTAGQNLEFFFDQWLNDSGIPELTTEWTILRVRNGYMIDGDLKQDLDLFRMPVELEIETDGEPDYKRVEVSGQASQFSVTTERRPKSVNIDPRKKILRMSPDIKVAVKINRGEEFMNEGRFNDARDEFQDAIDMDGRGSLAAFRMGEALFELGNLTPAVMNFRNALTGDLKPKWVEVWSYINLGKIYDIRGDRDRAVGEYQKAITTGDDSYGAQADAKKYIDTPFRRSER